MIWLTPRYAKDTNPFSWPIEAYDLMALESENSHPTLLIYTFGELSAHICSLVQHNPDKTGQYAALDEFFKPYYSRMPSYSPDEPDCQPKGYLASSWRYDELAGYGSYCNMQVEIDGADRHIQTLQDGMPERGIWFAGEHAAPIEERGTVGGAYMSAEIAAAKIVAKHQSAVTG
jgi:monoamine oxidase